MKGNSVSHVFSFNVEDCSLFYLRCEVEEDVEASERPGHEMEMLSIPVVKAALAHDVAVGEKLQFCSHCRSLPFLLVQAR